MLMVIKCKALISAAFATIFLTGCINADLSKQLRRLYNTQINSCTKLEQVYQRNISSQEAKIYPCKLIIYYDSLQCSSCGIQRLYDKIDLYELADSLDAFDVMTIFSPKEEEYDNVMKELMLFDFPYPVYVDTYGEFRRTNPDIPADLRFHTFLLDRDGHPVFVGDPVAGKELWTLFEKALANLIEDDGIHKNN